MSPDYAGCLVRDRTRKKSGDCENIIAAGELDRLMFVDRHALDRWGSLVV